MTFTRFFYVVTLMPLILLCNDRVFAQVAPVSEASESQRDGSPPDGIAAFPSRQVGDSCTLAYKDWNKELPVNTVRVAEVTPEGFVLDVLNAQGEKVRNAYFTTEGNPRFPYDFKQHRPFFKYPLVVGKKWSSSHTYPDRGGGITKTETTVVGWEEINVPAGKGKKFRALKIVVDGKYTEADGSGPIVETVWFVPDVQCIAKYTLQSRTPRGDLSFNLSAELVAFERK